VNLFLVNGHTATIAATVVARQLFSDQPCVLVSERANNRALPGRLTFPESDYAAVGDLLRSAFPWSERLDVGLNIRYVSLAQPLRFSAYVGYLRTRSRDLMDRLVRWGPVERVIASGNSVLWPLLLNRYGRRDTEYVLVEHGVSDYRHALAVGRPPALKAIARRVALAGLGYRSDRIPDRIILTDGGRSHAAQVAARQRPGQLTSALTSLDARSDLRRITQCVARGLRLHHRGAHDEVKELRQFLGEAHSRYEYLPTPEVELNQYQRYLGEQIREAKIALAGARFIIKPHPIDTSDYRPAFEFQGVQAWSFRYHLLRFVPAELLAAMVGDVTMMGSFSSSLLYWKWWFGGRSILAEPSGWDYSRSVAREYTPALKDFQALSADAT
jgi:hypothetical protein